MLNDLTLLRLLQLASPVLPVGAYSYSDGLETLIETGVINNQTNLLHWLKEELRYGAIRLETAVMVRAYSCASNSNFQGLGYWNTWLSAAKETTELREQSWQMGSSLIKLLIDLEKQRSNQIDKLESAVSYPCNYAAAFGIGAAHWLIKLKAAVLGYLHSWASNLIGAAVKLIPLGQTIGQKLLFEMNTSISSAAEKILVLEDEELINCGWGLSLASMDHENQYTRLFRS